jgi:hypothetical protein
MAKAPPAFLKKSTSVTGPKGNKVTVSKKLPPPPAAAPPGPPMPAFKKGGKVKK